jgi:ribosomal protein S18 acetylase RimI-like enzyme
MIYLYIHDNIKNSAEDIKAALLKLMMNDNFGEAVLILNENTPVGYMLITSAYSVEFKGETAFIDELYIDENYRNAGIGSLALLYAEKYAAGKGYKAVRLEVELSNKNAHMFYRRSGYTEHERYIMTKWLDK